MHLRVSHVTEYRYDELVPLCHNVLHVRPRETDRQTVLAHSLHIHPEPASQRDRLDFYGNHVTWLTLQEPHHRLRIESRSEVEVRPFERPDFLRWPTWDEVVQILRSTRDAATLEARQFVFDSPHVPRSSELAEYAAATFTPGRSMWEAVDELSCRIHREFRFDNRATAVGTPILHVLRDRRGVCQDFTHLMTGCLRSLGLAARYVSGFLVTRPPPGRPRLVGADATHAWVGVYFPELGWVDFDPTNGCIPSSEHITVAWGRDYEEVSPVRGVIVGGQGHTLSVAVDVEPISATTLSAGTGS